MLKRALDIAVSLAVLVVLSPLLIVVAVVLRLTGDGEVLYAQRRVGLGGEDFRLLKFATMVADSENLGSKDITLHDDPRVLPVGRFLRKSKINELPQLFNVLLGDMSLVGWRPLLRAGFERYAADVRNDLIQAKPGLTGIGSLVFRNEEEIVRRSAKPPEECYRDEIMPYKGALERWYLEHQSTWLDFKILVATALAILAPSNRRILSWFVDLPRNGEAEVD